MSGHDDILSCPFCDKGRIKCLYFPSQWSVKAKRTKTLPGRGSVSKSAEDWIVQSKCPECGKSEGEIRKALKEGQQTSDEQNRKKRLEQLKKAGFPGVIVSKVKTSQIT